MSNTLHIPEFAQGILYAWSQEAFLPMLKHGVEDDVWQAAQDVPLSAGENCSYEDYDLNFWYDEDDNKWHCTAYAIGQGKDNSVYTKTDEWLRLW